MTIEEDYNKRKKRMEDLNKLKELCEAQELKIAYIKDFLKEILKYINKDIYDTKYYQDKRRKEEWN